MVLTFGVGYTAIVNVFDEPGQLTVGLPPTFMGVTEMVAVAVVVPLLIAVKAAIFPEPLPGRPIAELSFTQVYAVALMPVKITGMVLAPLHNIWFAEGSMKTV